MTRELAVTNSMSVFAYLVTFNPKAIVNLTHYSTAITIQFHCSEWTDDELDDYAKKLDAIRLCGTTLNKISHVSSIDGTVIKSIDIYWEY